MRFWTSAACIVAVAASAWAQPSIEQFMRIRAAGMPEFTPDGTLYVRDWPDGIYQVYRVEGGVSKPEAPGTKLTSFPDGVTSYSISPDGRHILAMAAPGGNEFWSIHHVDPAGGAPKQLRGGEKVQHAVNIWLPDSSGFVYTANDAVPSDFHVYRYDFAGDKVTKLLAKEGSWSASGVTKDGSRLLVGQYRSISDSSLLELDAKTGGLTDLTPSASDSPTVSVSGVGYMPDESSVLYLSDADGGLLRLYRRELKTGKVSRPIPALDKFELDTAAMNTERSLLGVVANEDGFGVLRVYRLPSFEEVPLPPIERGVVSLNQIEGHRVVWTLDNARTPGLAFAYDVPAGKAAGRARQVTFADTQGLDLAGFPLPELVKVKSFDGVEVPSFVFVPPGYQRGTPIPFVVNYHGGPEGQHRPGFDRVSQYLLSRGYGILKPNVRGSTGYGRAFHMMDDYKKRWDSVKDGVDAANWLVSNGYARPGKIAAYGGSYGGYMSVAAVVEDSSRAHRVFGASVDVVGIVSFKTFLERTADYRRKLREVEYGPLSDPEFLDSVSPLLRANEIQVPMMIAHGINDPRVPVFEAVQLASYLHKRDLDPELLFFPDEGHGFAKLENRLIFAERMASFLDETIAK